MSRKKGKYDGSCVFGFDNDFENKNREAVLGITESDEEFAKNNKKTLKRVMKDNDFKYIVFFVFSLLVLGFGFSFKDYDMLISLIFILSGISLWFYSIFKLGGYI